MMYVIIMLVLNGKEKNQRKDRQKIHTFGVDLLKYAGNAGD